VSPPEHHPEAEPQHWAEALEISAHCLLRLMTALLLETEEIIPLHPAESAELNARTGRCYSARQWALILEPSYQRRFGRHESMALMCFGRSR